MRRRADELRPVMLRLTELRLPLDHPPEALDAAVAERLGAVPLRYSVFARIL